MKHLLNQFPRFLAISAVLTGTAIANRSMAEDGPVVVFAGDAWMPFNGTEVGEQPGYVIEIAQKLCGKSVSFQAMAFEDAIEAVRKGNATAVIGINEEEGNGLTMGKEPVGVPATCLVSLPEKQWEYQNVMSLRGAKLGAIKGYSYWEALDHYIEKQSGSDSVVLTDSEEPLDELIAMLLEHKIDVLVESDFVFFWSIRKLNYPHSRFKVVFRGVAEPVFIGFSPTPQGAKLADFFDNGIRRLRSTGELHVILGRYGVTDWAQQQK